MASVLFTYFLWLIGGFFGLHHLYLGRFNHAFVWFATFGGVFGLGWLRDLWRIPFYVSWRNGDKECQKEHLSFMATKQGPSGGLIRSLGMFVMGYLASAVFCGLLPNYHYEADLSFIARLFYRLCMSFFILAGSSIGVGIVANIGEMQCSFFYPAVGSLLGIPWLINSEQNVSVPTIFATLVTWWFGMQWRPISSESSSKRGIVNLFIFLLGISLWSGILCLGVYHHAEITINNGERIPLRVALNNFLASPAWSQLKDSFYRLYTTMRNDGWHSAFRDTVYILDFSGEANALKILGLDQDASKEAITKKCRKLSSQFHPDRQKTSHAKAEAEAEFLKIREACNVLTTKPYQRSRRS